MNYQQVLFLRIKVHLRGCINMHYEVGYMSLCQNRSTNLNTYYEQGYFELIMDQTCQHESKKIISCVKANQFIFA